LSPAAHQHGHTGIPNDAAFVHIHTNIVMADVTVEPGRTGPVQVSIHLAKEDFTNYSARHVKLELQPPEGDIASITRAAKPEGEARWRIDGLALQRPGIWTIRLFIAPQHGSIVMLDAPIVIGPREQE
jgi:copper transport protein